MYLVGVHAQVTGAAAPLLERTLNALVEDIADEALRCFRQVKRFGMGGMLRVRFTFELRTVEIFLLHSSFQFLNLVSPLAPSDLQFFISTGDARD